VTTALQRTVLVLGRRAPDPALLFPDDVDGSMAVVVIAIGWPLTDAQTQAVDHALGDGPPLGVESVGIPRPLDELLLGAGRDLDDLGAEGTERFHLEFVSAGRRSVARSSRGDDLELRHGPTSSSGVVWVCRAIRWPGADVRQEVL